MAKNLSKNATLRRTQSGDLLAMFKESLQVAKIARVRLCTDLLICRVQPCLPWSGYCCCFLPSLHRITPALEALNPTKVQPDRSTLMMWPNPVVFATTKSLTTPFR